MTSTSSYSRIAGKKCLICGDKASAYNFHGLSCESCKIFFRRNAFRDDLKCPKTGNCPLDSCTRKACAYCRLKRCFEIGMRRELLATRPQKRRRELKGPSKSVVTGDIDLTAKTIFREERTFFLNSQLNAHEWELIGELEQAMGHFVDENAMRVVGQITDFFDAFNLYGRYVKQVVKFVKTMSAYKALDSDDQLAILKPFYSEIVSIRTAYLYDRRADAFRIIVNDWEDKVAIVPMECYRNCKMFDIETYCRNFLTALHSTMEGDTVLRNLIIAQNLFLQRNSTAPLKRADFIQNQNLVYCRLIARYLNYKYPHSRALADGKFSELMLLLGELNFIRSTMRQVAVEQMSERPVDEVLVEVYDLK